MATLCTHCGHALKDSARFCNVCGTLVPSHPLRPKAASSSTSHAAQFQKTSEAIHEQIAQHSPSPHPPARFPAQHEAPSWMRQLENSAGIQRKTPILPQEPEEPASSFSQMDFPVPEPEIRSNSPVRELRFKVWEQNEPAVPLTPNGTSMPAGGDGFNDMPTRPLVAGTPEKLGQPHSPTPLAYKQQGAHVDKLERLDTVPLATQKGVKPPQASVAVLKPRKSRKRLVITLISLLLFVLIGSVGAWIVLYQPFSVPGITQPLQSFSNTQLGLSLLYPSVWEVQVDQSTVTAHFYDSSHTAQVNIVVSPTHGEDLAQYLQQEATRLGMTGQKMGTSLSFAGTSWQQLQGNVQQRGASYTETLLVTVHNQHLYMMMVLAPQITYAQEDQLVFSGIRSSFQFLAS